MNSILSCFFPTTIVAIDDNVNFLKSLRDILGSKHITVKGFSDPIEGLNFINESSIDNPLAFSDLTVNGDDETSDWKSILFNINKIHSQIYDINRFSKVSAVIVDYSMPGIDGVELCSQILDPNIQRLLLTGVADEKVAIDAFNNGHINRFTRKSSPDIVEELTQSINRAVQQYFSVYTSDLMKHLPMKDMNNLRDPILANFFYGTCLNRNYIEYYMLDTFGSYLFLREDGQANLLSVMPESEVDRIIEIGIDSEEISDEVLHGLQSHEYMLVFHSRTGALPPITEWDKYLRPARRLEGYQTYYFAFAESEMLDLDFGKIKSFNKFRRMQQNSEHYRI